MLFSTKKMDERYNNASVMQIALFSLNTAATTMFLALMEYTSYFVNGVLGFAVMFTSVILTGLRIFDGVIDPFIGFIVDRTEGKFGKFRPFMVIGNVMMASSSFVLFYASSSAPKVLRLLIFILSYMTFVVGYTFQMIVAKSGQTVMTNNPKLRPLATYFDSLFITSCFGGTSLYVSAYLIPKYGGYTNKALYTEFALFVISISAVCTVLALIGIWKKDRKEYYEAVEERKITIKDYMDVLAHNKPIRMLVTAASINKFAQMVYGNITVGVMLFGIMMQNYKMYGQIGLITAIPNLIVVTIGVAVAQRVGQKKAFTIFTWLAVVFQIVMTAVLLFGNLTEIGLTRFNGISFLFFLVYILLNGSKSVSNNIVVPMIADCSDYEVFRSGMYVPGLMGALFSFVDQVISALGTAFVGAAVALIGFRKILPQVGDPMSVKIKMVTILCYCAVPIIAWLISLFTMRYYELDQKAMAQINEDRHKKHSHRKTLHLRKNC